MRVSPDSQWGPVKPARRRWRPGGLGSVSYDVPSTDNHGPARPAMRPARMSSQLTRPMICLTAGGYPYASWYDRDPDRLRQITRHEQDLTAQRGILPVRPWPRIGSTSTMA